MKFIVLLIAAVAAQCDDTDSSGYDTVDCCSEDQTDNVADSTVCPNGAVAAEGDGDGDGDGEGDGDGDGEGDGEGDDDEEDDGDDDGGSGLPESCTSADDCEEGEVCATSEITDTDTEHADYSEEADEIMNALMPLSACVDAEECETAAEDLNTEDSPYTFEVSCGATKLVASFAALALASAM